MLWLFNSPGWAALAFVLAAIVRAAQVEVNEAYVHHLKQKRINRPVNVLELVFTPNQDTNLNQASHHEIFLETMDDGKPLTGIAWLVGYDNQRDWKPQMGKPLHFITRAQTDAYDESNVFDKGRTRHLGRMDLGDLLKAHDLVRNLQPPQSWEPKSWWKKEFSQPRYQCKEWVQDAVKLLFEHDLIKQGSVKSDAVAKLMAPQLDRLRQRRQEEFKKNMGKMFGR